MYETKIIYDMSDINRIIRKYFIFYFFLGNKETLYDTQ